MSTSGKQLKEKRSAISTTAVPTIQPRSNASARARLAKTLERVNSRSPSITGSLGNSYNDPKAVNRIKSPKFIGEAKKFYPAPSETKTEHVPNESINNIYINCSDVITPRSSTGTELLSASPSIDNDQNNNSNIIQSQEIEDAVSKLTHIPVEVAPEYGSRPTLKKIQSSLTNLLAAKSFNDQEEVELCPPTSRSCEYENMARSPDLVTDFLVAKPEFKVETPEFKVEASELKNKKQYTNENHQQDGNVTFDAKLEDLKQMRQELEIKKEKFKEYFETVQCLHLQLPLDEQAKHALAIYKYAMKNEEVGVWSRCDAVDICNGFNKENFDFDDENPLCKVRKSLSLIRSVFTEFCFDALEKRQDIVDWIKGLVDYNNEIGVQVKVWSTQGQCLVENLGEVDEKAKVFLDNAADITQQIWYERCTLLDKGEELMRKVEELQEAIKEAQNHQLPSNSSELTVDTKSTRDSHEDANKCKQLECQLKIYKGKVIKLEKQLKEMSSSLADSVATVKFLEDENRRFDSSNDQQVKKLRDSVRSNKILVGQMKQKIVELENRVKELTDEKTKVTEQHTQKMGELRTMLQEMRQKLATSTEQHKKLQNEIANREKAANLGLSKSDMELKADLVSTKHALTLSEEMVEVLKEEKNRLLQTLANLNQSASDDLVPQRVLASELLMKEEMITSLHQQIRACVRDCKFFEEKSEFLEKHLAGQPCSTADPKNELKTLKLNLLELKRKNDDLTASLTTQEAALERERRGNKAHADNTKVREELLSMMKRREAEQTQQIAILNCDLNARIAIVDQVNKQISSKAEEIQKLFTSLEEKDLCIEKLEKTLSLRDNQHDHFQAERLRHEQRIAELEKQLQEANDAINHKRFFLF